LLNTLTRADVLAEDKLFATLDPTSRKLFVAGIGEVILTDTVGFIRRLPPDLKEAFRATLEELESADVLVHVADASHPEVEEQIAAVESILNEMDLGDTPRLLCLNKWELLSPDEQAVMQRLYPAGIPVTALKRRGLIPLVAAILGRLPMDALVGPLNGPQNGALNTSIPQDAAPEDIVGEDWLKDWEPGGGLVQ
jgi:GTP-binding protein HflX